MLTHSHSPGTTLIVDEIPGRIVGDDDWPPGRVLHLGPNGETLWETSALKMPYDAVPCMAARTRESLEEAIAQALTHISSAEAAAFFAHCGFRQRPDLAQWFCP